MMMIKSYDDNNIYIKKKEFTDSFKFETISCVYLVVQRRKRGFRNY